MSWKLRAEARGRKVMVSSSHPLATLAGVRVFADGGNCFDAALAVSSTLCVVQNNLCGLGGDMFALLGNLGGDVKGLNSSGRAGESCTPDYFKGLGLSRLPSRGPLSAVTVPGLVDGWREIHRGFCSMEFSDLLKHAVSAAVEGFPVTANYSSSIKASAKVLSEYDGWRNCFMKGGQPPEPGTVFKQPDLGRTLRTVAEEGPDTFYRGWLSERIVAGARKAGCVLTEDDFRLHYSTWDEPLSTTYRGVTVYETAPNSQAATALLWLNMLERFDVSGSGFGSPKTVETLLDSCELSYSERAKWIGDPAYVSLPEGFLGHEYAEKLLAKAPTAASKPVAQGRGDTTYFAVADADGNFASVIQSNYRGFGSGVVPEGTGLVLHNRGSYFTLDPAHHNVIAPRKRTFHTLCASAASVDDQPLFVMGCMGGDIQPQVHVQLITNVLDHGMDPQEAIDAPRWAAEATIYDESFHYIVESPLAAAVQGVGGRVFEDIGRKSSAMGHAQMIKYEKSGSLTGGADGRGDGLALGY